MEKTIQIACRKSNCDNTGRACLVVNQVDAVKQILVPKGWSAANATAVALDGSDGFEDFIDFTCPGCKAKRTG